MNLFQRTTNILLIAERAEDGKRGALTKLANLVRKSSLARIFLISTIKLLTGCFMLSHLCFETTTDCPYGFLRGVITTVDYQLYYMDYILTQMAKKDSIQEKGAKMDQVTTVTTPKASQVSQIN